MAPETNAMNGPATRRARLRVSYHGAHFHGFAVNNDVETVEGNLTQLAKNSAVEEGANTIVRGASSSFGERQFELYQCN